MTWNEFLLVYLSITALVVLRMVHRLKGRWSKLLRAVVFIASIFWLLDYVANDRTFWGFSKLWGIAILLNPIENTLFGVATSINLILLYLWLDRGNRDGICRP